MNKLLKYILGRDKKTEEQEREAKELINKIDKIPKLMVTINGEGSWMVKEKEEVKDCVVTCFKESNKGAM